MKTAIAAAEPDDRRPRVVVYTSATSTWTAHPASVASQVAITVTTR